MICTKKTISKNSLKEKYSKKTFWRVNLHEDFEGYFFEIKDE